MSIFAENDFENRKKSIDQELLKIKTQKKTVLNEIYRLELKIEKETIKLRNIQREIEKQTFAIDSLEKEKSILILKIQISRQNLKRALRIMYKSQAQPPFLFFMRIDSFNHLYQHYQYFVRIFDFKINQISNINKQLDTLAIVENRLNNENNKLLSLKTSIENSLNTIKGNKTEQLKFMEKVNNDFEHFSQLSEEIKNQNAELDKVIAEQPHYHKIERININHLRGKMPKPIRGKLLSRFGKIKSTRFDTYIYNNGIKIKPEAGDKIQSVFSGVVVFASYFKGYGNLIIIRHTKELYTLYGHCQEIKKIVGDWVLQGETLAIVGDTGSTTGKVLYFEVRRGLKSEDPLLWFSKK